MLVVDCLLGGIGVSIDIIQVLREQLCASSSRIGPTSEGYSICGKEHVPIPIKLSDIKSSASSMATTVLLPNGTSIEFTFSQRVHDLNAVTPAVCGHHALNCVLLRVLSL